MGNSRNCPIASDGLGFLEHWSHHPILTEKGQAPRQKADTPNTVEYNTSTMSVLSTILFITPDYFGIE